ncbi:Cys/Met metabolism PLP-dependent enzyme [Rhizoctonia solani]|uniref:cystathionine gamma-lyase n=1 Tax=Rhizoctonia solani TaxID=456999 RepID=A0A8H7I6H8_9AGAM|nr:Cys/Met metabolism PLP-dependent enzyme [Rhizoctonia solani]
MVHISVGSASFGTRAIHIGAEPNAETGAVIEPISLSTTYKQEGVGLNKGYEYSRCGNPNRVQLELLLASLEAGGGNAVTFASGTATTTTVLQALGSNAHIVSMHDVYGGTYTQLFDDQITASFRDNTKLIWIESPTNPTLRIVDIHRIVQLARKHPSNPLVLVDNTFLSPFYSSPLLLGADAVVHSLTKYINGHSDVLMGALIVPSASDHPRAAAFAERVRFLQNAGGPFQAHMTAAHGRNALRVASYLQQISGPESSVESVIYPGLAIHPRHQLAVKQLSPHSKSCQSGGVESLAQIPARMTHGSIPETERNALGITSNLVRLSIGIEDADDLIADIQQALATTLPHLAHKLTVCGSDNFSGQPAI